MTTSSSSSESSASSPFSASLDSDGGSVDDEDGDDVVVVTTADADANSCFLLTASTGEMEGAAWVLERGRTEDCFAEELPAEGGFRLEEDACAGLAGGAGCSEGSAGG